MKIVLTAEEILKKGVWMEFCELKGIDEWALNEGLIFSDEEFCFTEDEARELGFLGGPAVG